MYDIIAKPSQPDVITGERHLSSPYGSIKHLIHQPSSLTCLLIKDAKGMDSQICLAKYACAQQSPFPFYISDIGPLGI